jgi:hypothetical protein
MTNKMVFSHGIIFLNIYVTKLSLFLNAKKKLGSSQLGFREAEAFTPFFNFQRFVFYFLSLGLHFGGKCPRRCGFVLVEQFSYVSVSTLEEGTRRCSFVLVERCSDVGPS